MKTKPIVIGGSGGGSSGPIELANSLRSKAFATLLDLISEGEIEGLVNGAKSVYFDGTPLQNSDNTYNFNNVVVTPRTGTQAQTSIAGFGTVESEVQVGMEFKYSNPLIRTVTNSEINAVRIQIYLPILTITDTTTGDINGGQVKIAIDVQSNGGGYVNIVNDTIRGKSNSRYDRTYRVPLTGSGPWDIKLRRVTADAVSSSVQDKIYWDTYTELIDAKLSYPNSALVGVKIDATQFSSVPTRGYDIKGIKILLPENYDPIARTYTGVWDGDFSAAAWSDNPAWIFYDLLTNKRYGLGSYIDATQVDKWALYTVAKYCDELVDAGKGDGSTEPRFTCNVYLQSRAEAYKVINDFASIFRGMAFWAEGLITAVQDAPSTEVDYLYSQASVVGGIFSYAGASQKQRHSVALVSWNDPSDSYKQKIEYVEDQTAIARFGAVETEVTAFGCTSRGQAHRVGKWLLYTEQYESEVVTFKVGLEGASARPGQIIKVCDAMRAGVRLGGRISAATSTTVTIDGDVTLDLTGAILYCQLPDGTTDNKPIQSIAGRVITLTSALSATPNAQSSWAIKTLNIEPQTFRVLGIGENEDGTYPISAISFNASKFDFIESNIALEVRPISLLSGAPSNPTGLKLTESLYQAAGDVKTRLSVSWDRVSAPVSYKVQYRRDDGNATNLVEQSSNDVELLDAQPGVYEISVTAISSLGNRSLPTTLTQTVFGKTAAPVDVTNFRLSPLGQNAFLTWDSAPDLDVIVGGFVKIRFTNDLISPTWNNSVDLVQVPGASVSVVTSLITGTYFAKFVDSSGNISATAAEIQTTAPDLANFNAVDTLTESPGFTGAKTDCIFDSTLVALTLDGSGDLDSVPDFDAIADFNFFSGKVVSTGTYLFSGSEDLGAVYPCHLVASMVFNTFTEGTLVDSITDLVDNWGKIDGDSNDNATATMYYRETNDDPAGSPTWSAWKPFLVIDTQARAFQFKVVLNSSDSISNIAVTSLSVLIDMADRIEHQNGLVSGTANPFHVTFAAPFKVAPAIAITAFTLATGDYWLITNKTATGFDIVFKNIAGTIITKTFDMIAKGYGKYISA